jgi:hypothetical protein
MNAEVVDLAVVVTPTVRWTRVVSVGTTDGEADRAATESPGLALETSECPAVVDTKSYRVFSPKGMSTMYPA